MNWILSPSSNFMRQRKRYENTPVNEKIRKAIRELQNSSDPRKLGTFKRGRKYAAYYYNLDQSFRLVYDVIEDELVILLLDVGDHKQVYGKVGCFDLIISISQDKKNEVSAFNLIDPAFQYRVR